MPKNFLKTKNLNRSALKEINGGARVPLVNCFTLCGVAGEVISGTPGGNKDRTICCIWY